MNVCKHVCIGVGGDVHVGIWEQTRKDIDTKDLVYVGSDLWSTLK